MIHPNVISYTLRPSDLKNRKAISILKLPQKNQSDTADRCVIDQIRCQPKPNEISNLSQSSFKDDISQMVGLLGAYCKNKPIDEIYKNIEQIHGTLNNKAAPEIKNWIRLLTGLHPELDKKIKNLGFWKTPYSEAIGTNTITYYPGPESVDIIYWSKAPTLTTNEVKTPPLQNPSFIRESIREKLDSAVVELIQNSNHLTMQYLRRNLIWESLLTTAKGTGREAVQSRPIDASTVHGVSLNNDWYHGDRVAACRSSCKSDAVNYLCKNGANCDKLVNHLTPLINSCKAQTVAARFESPLGVEETFPRRLSNLIADIDNSGQKVLKTPDKINNDVLKPEIIKGE
jgi:hypothetical protein